MIIPSLRDIYLLALEIKPVLPNEKGKLYFIKNTNIDGKFTVNPEYILPANGLEEIGEIQTLHESFYETDFSPTVRDVLKQIPDEIMDKNPVAFKIEVKNYQYDDSKHLAKVTFYTGKLPNNIKKQPVIYNGKELTFPF